MTDKERTAIAMLTSGSSFKDAADSNNIPVMRLMELWQKRQNNKA